MTNPPSEKRPGWAVRFDTWVRRTPLVLLVVLGLFLLTTAGDVTGWVRGAKSWYDSRYHWREQEYEKLAALRGGYTLDKFEETFGAPGFRRVEHGIVESTFQERDYWVQAVSHERSGTVIYFAVTSCSLRFNPTFRLPDTTPITLNRSTLASIAPAHVENYADYFAPGATANAHFYEINYGGNPGNYKSFLWGYNDACLNLPHWTEYWQADLYEAFPFARYYGSPRGGGAPLAKFRRRLLANTYAETAPTSSFADRAGVFQVGVDRILVRTVTHPTYDPPSLPLDPPMDVRSPDMRLRTEEGLTEGSQLVLPTARDSLRRMAGCLRSPLSFSFASVSVGVNAIWYGDLPPRMLSYVGGARLLHVRGPFFRSGFNEQRAVILLARDQTRAARIAKAVQRNESGYVQTINDIVVIWKRRPNRPESRVLGDCLLG